MSLDSHIDMRTREGRALRSATVEKATEKAVASLSDLARAEARLREIRGQMPEGGENRDKFWAPSPPEGWDYQWKRRTIYNQEDPSYQVELSRNGWEAVPLSRHPEMMPKNWQGNTIEVEGQVLMERPKILTDEARARELRAARDIVKTKEAQLRSGRSDDLGPRQVLAHKKSREAIQIPDEE